MMWSQWSWYGWLVMTVGMVAFWAMVAYVVIAMTGRSKTDPAGDDTPEAILRRRLARGEIDDDDYRRRLATLDDRSYR